MSSRILLTVTSPRWLGARGAGCVVGEGAGWNCTVGPALGALMVGWHPGTGQTVGSDDAMWCAQREWPQRRVSGAARVCAQRGQARTSRRESMVVVGRARTAGASVRYNGVDSHRRRRAQSLDPARSIGRGQGACIGTCPASTGPDLHQLGTARARPPIRFKISSIGDSAQVLSMLSSLTTPYQSPPRLLWPLQQGTDRV